MAREPRYPDDAAVGDSKRAGGGENSAAPTPAPKPASKPAEAPAEPGGDGKRNRKIVTGAAIGIGSAAIVAALLYANRRGRNERG